MGFGSVSTTDFDDGFSSHLIIQNTRGFLATLPLDAGFIQLTSEELEHRANTWNETILSSLVDIALTQGGIELACRDKLFVIAPSPYLSCSGKVRITHYSNGRIKGPISESHAACFKDAIRTLLCETQDLDVTHGLLDQWMEEPEFLKGFEVANLIGMLNAGKISFSEFCSRNQSL